MGEKIIWDGDAFADMAARLKEAEGRLDKLERPWVEARAQRRRELFGEPPVTREMLDDAVTLRKLTEELSHKSPTPPNIVLEPKGQPAGAGDNRTVALNASIADLLREIERLNLAVDEYTRNNSNQHATILRLQARIAEVERQNADLQASNNRMLERLRAGASKFNDMLGRG